LELETTNATSRSTQSGGAKKSDKHKSIFNKYKWEYTNYIDEEDEEEEEDCSNNTQRKTKKKKAAPPVLLSVGLVPVKSISQVVYVVPDFRSMQAYGQHSGLRTNYMNVATKTDRYWHVPRTYTDRSGYDHEVEAQSRMQIHGDGSENDFDERLMDLFLVNQEVNMQRQGFRDFDMGEVLGEQDEDEADRDDDFNNRAGMIRLRRNGFSEDDGGEDEDDVF
jgi:hypothetical protein